LALALGINVVVLVRELLNLQENAPVPDAWSDECELRSTISVVHLECRIFDEHIEAALKGQEVRIGSIPVAVQLEKRAQEEMGVFAPRLAKNASRLAGVGLQASVLIRPSPSAATDRAMQPVPVPSV
jgi:hypothetical protein